MNNKKEIKYEGILFLGNAEIPCYVLEDGTRVLSGRGLQFALKMVDDVEKDTRIPGTRLQRYLNQKSLEPFIYKDKKLDHYNPIECYNGNQKINGYEATILADICDAFLEARKHIKLSKRQNIIAKQCEIIIRGFAKVGIISLIDEATGYQINRKSDALRQLLQVYLAEGIKKWIKEFPDDFFFELDRLYGNQNLKSSQRPAYYGSFINTYVYGPLENGKINPELQKRYKDDKKIHRKHQHFSDFGSQQLRIQIGKILGLMQISPNLEWFKRKQKNQGQLSLFPDFE